MKMGSARRVSDRGVVGIDGSSATRGLSRKSHWRHSLRLWLSGIILETHEPSFRRFDPRVLDRRALTIVTASRKAAPKDIGQVRRDTGSLPADRGLRELTNSRRALTSPQAGFGHPPVQPPPVRRGVMQCFDELRPSYHFRDIERSVRTVDTIPDQRTRDARWKAVAGQTDPHLPIFCVAQARIEWTHPEPGGPPHRDVDSSGRNRVVMGQSGDNLLGIERRPAVDDSTVLGDVHCAGIRPVAAGRLAA